MEIEIQGENIIIRWGGHTKMMPIETYNQLIKKDAIQMPENLQGEVQSGEGTHLRSIAEVSGRIRDKQVK